VLLLVKLFLLTFAVILLLMKLVFVRAAGVLLLTFLHRCTLCCP
jgi:hypothetical protein